MKKSFLYLLALVILLPVVLIGSQPISAQESEPENIDQPTMPKDFHADLTAEALEVLPKEIKNELKSDRNLKRVLTYKLQPVPAVVAGSYLEDFDFSHGIPNYHHSWNPDSNEYWPTPVVPGSGDQVGTALDWADHYFRLALNQYAEGDQKEAYVNLGRVIHLLGDMATPAHVHLDEHIDGDTYEDHLDHYPITTVEGWPKKPWNYQAVRTTAPDELKEDGVLTAYNKISGADDSSAEMLWALGPKSYSMPGDKYFAGRVDPDLFHIFHSMAEIADSFSSDDEPGEETGSPYDLSDLTKQENILVPACAERIAAVIQLFWDRTHPSSNVDVILIIDSSGSMGGNDSNNKRLDAAKTYLTVSVPGDHVGVVDFDSYAKLVGPLQHAHNNKDNLYAAIESIDSSGGTDIGAGLQLACDTLLASSSGNTTKAAILLTDGNGSFSDQDTCFAAQRWPIYTFGFGSANDVLLNDIATRTGGEFERLDTSNFICKFQAVRTKIAGGIPGECNSSVIHPLEIIKHLLNVPKIQLQLTVSISWSGSDVELSLTSPSGRVFDRDTVDPDVVHDLGATFESYTITNPEAGEWEISLYGADVPEEGEEVVYNHTTVPVPASDLGSITVNKRAPFDVEESFDFSGDLGSFAIRHKETTVFDQLIAGEYAVTELVSDGWNLDTVECGEANVTAVEDGVKIQLDAGESVTCIFQNSKTGQISIRMRAPEGIEKKFRFSGDLGTFGLRHKETRVFENLVAGDYMIAADEWDGWRIESVECGDANIAAVENGVGIKLDEGEEVLCTFLNSPADLNSSIFMPMVSGN